MLGWVGVRATVCRPLHNYRIYRYAHMEPAPPPTPTYHPTHPNIPPRQHHPFVFLTSRMLSRNSATRRDIAIRFESFRTPCPSSGKRKVFGAPAELAHRAHELIRLRHRIARIVGAVDHHDRRADILDMGDRRDLEEELPVLGIVDVAVLDPIAGFERGRGPLERRDPVRNPNHRNATFEELGKLGQRRVGHVSAVGAPITAARDASTRPSFLRIRSRRPCRAPRWGAAAGCRGARTSCRIPPIRES